MPFYLKGKFQSIYLTINLKKQAKNYNNFTLPPEHPLVNAITAFRNKAKASSFQCLEQHRVHVERLTISKKESQQRLN